ncbi:membrane-bound lytic murein transglycosylase MltC [Alteromonas sp. a30]|nr:membrane-bound lytic murein transglycosylase MltC [Alteromonas sp. a30]
MAATVTFLLLACSATDQRNFVQALQTNKPEQALKSFAKRKELQYKNDPTALVRDIQSIKKLLDELRGNAGKVWGKKEAKVPSKKKYVKYTDNYRSRALVDFGAGTITVETINTQNPNQHLKDAIVTTLLTTDDPTATDIFTDKSPQFNGKPYLYGQVLDHDKKPIRYQWRASRYADHLITTQMKSKRSSKGTTYYVTVPMERNHEQLRKQKYSQYVLASASKYQVQPELIYAIIETESSFNPFAVSAANAYGLMQVVPSTAGKDVYTRIKKRNDKPTKSVLFKPEQNIDIGTAYLHILDDIYLKKVSNSTSREYSIISAYNGGAGNVFKTFSRDRKNAPAVINNLTPSQVYWRLTQKHPRAESRRYLEKVTKFKSKY